MSLYDSIAMRASISASSGALGVGGRVSVSESGVTGSVGGSANIGGVRVGGAINSNGTGRLSVGGNGFGASIDSSGRVSGSIGIGGVGPGFSGGGSGGCVSPVWGGISLEEAKSLHLKSLETRLAHKNLWMIEVASSPLAGDFTEVFNLFAHSVEFTPVTLAGDKIPIGSAVMDTITSAQPIELSVTTRDDQYGTLRRWFDAHAAEVANADGTIGYPADYAISLKITHAFVTPDSNMGGFEDKARYRPGSVNVSLSREEQNAELLTMTFIQLDTFMAWR